MQIPSFDGTTIEGSVSRSGVFAAFDWERLLLGPLGAPIIRKSKIKADRRLCGFPAHDRRKLIEKLGHYSDVQSLNCEDTLTWSVFGTAEPKGWLNDMLIDVFGPAQRPESWHVALWSRIPHPRTGKETRGPEPDVVIENGKWRYVIEAKWTSDISVHRHGETQIEMRALQARDNVADGQWGVIVVAPPPATYSCATEQGSVFRRYFEPEGKSYIQLGAAMELNAQALTWERLVELISGRGYPKLQAYMDWRGSFLTARNKNI